MTHLMTTSAPTGLTVSGLTVRYGRAVALDKVDLEIPSGQVTALVGAPAFVWFLWRDAR